ncbi:protein tyrosine phosphatase domain-containing protein 1-like isoform X1 [Scyliorhinus canicula]|uniref:protein tyrosine phosphatase domain-containing protein 1-like isoform X1 n=2 Tax=Scyliorhinus canicula TaxID=7830 RepID=UPI0018F2D204|nr:protein tyrosine phosphatase domain-containing protein 1-like isoform X1 [Scyliorhinus canicula]XP_038668661.1 protein tyrosine phosphatase domain-containing protein 1-like isoform X1 [Scyliorhinus canicula]XP_038668662.1 protein tyrosine phosphatase domain-containing protein 1-like isoform X1 [Scyliorhinus canicula]XP_038668663.1 protein tyrosine phosphatase domain-containing protein 1-like isoform X1 [Scyliorhinus canicula]XP_038668664.1 protein tyrosine phosphatase domain-containing prote
MATRISLHPELPYSSLEHRRYIVTSEKGSMRRPTAKYTKVGERLRHVIPGHMQCSMACGGRACKYENPSRWSEEEQALKGLYSSWITDNILAMARPSTEIIEKYSIIEQFQRHGIKTVINLQRPGEHARCGNPLEPVSGFTYLPEVFMEAGNYFYNFGWKDYGVASLTTILDMVKVMAFALQEGKLAIHCHAGLGRTGVLIACYLVFATRMSADQAILFVRAKRPNAIQTRGQLLCVREFSQFLIPFRNVFSCCDPRAHAVTVSQYLIRQRHLLHGYEARQLRHVPKIIHLICKWLLDFAENRQLIEEGNIEIPDLSAEIEKTVSQLGVVQLDKEFDSQGFDMGDHFEHTTTEFIPNNSVLVSEQEFDPLWKRRNADFLQPLSHLKKRLSYSESDLQRAELFAEQSETPFTAPAHVAFPGKFHQQSLSQLNLRQPSPIPMEINQISPSVLKVPELCLMKQGPSITFKSNPWECQKPSNANDQKVESPLFIRRKLSKEIHRTLSSRPTTAAALKYLISEAPNTVVTSHGTGNVNEEECTRVNATSKQNARVAKGNLFPPPLCKKSAEKAPVNHKKVFALGDEERKANWSAEDIPCITLQSEMSIEERRLAAGKAMAFCMNFDEDLIDKVEMWQRELNVREGTWERIRTEKNPYVLCSLMWSWLEQLKEPVISKEDVESLAHKYMDPNKAFYSLGKGQYQTLLCIIDCMAQLRDLPFDVEDAILTRAIRAFTKVSFDADEGPKVYNTLKTILKPILEEKQAKLADCDVSNNCAQNVDLQIH